MNKASRFSGFALLAIAAVLPLQTLAASVKTFSDVFTSTSYKEAINWSVQEGITSGYGNGKWGPDVCVKRAELVKMVMEAGAPNLGYAPTITGGAFKDVKTSDWYNRYLWEAKESGVITGYEDGTFRPNNCVNRVEAMKVVVSANLVDKFEEWKNGSSNSSSPVYYDNKVITDMDSAAWYSSYAKFLFSKRFVGTDHTVLDAASTTSNLYAIKFSPNGVMTRKEVVEMLYRIDKAYPGIGNPQY